MANETLREMIKAWRESNPQADETPQAEPPLLTMAAGSWQEIQRQVRNGYWNASVAWTLLTDLEEEVRAQAAARQRAEARVQRSERDANETEKELHEAEAEAASLRQRAERAEAKTVVFNGSAHDVAVICAIEGCQAARLNTAANNAEKAAKNAEARAVQYAEKIDQLVAEVREHAARAERGRNQSRELAAGADWLRERIDKLLGENEAERKRRDELRAVVLCAVNPVLAQLRHAYLQITIGTAMARMPFADGLIAPQIRALEGLQRKLSEGIA